MPGLKYATLVITLACATALAGCQSGGQDTGRQATPSSDTATVTPTQSGPAPGASATQTATTPVRPTQPAGPLANTTKPKKLKTITGKISPKSVTASATGTVSAHNMMYTHTVTMYDSDGNLQATINDGVDLSKFGISGHPGISRGAPVEGAYSPDGRHLYVSNYNMYGSGFGPEGKDTCSPASNVDKSYVYRIDTQTHAIDQVIPAGAVPKFIQVTPDGSMVLVTNWCSWDLTVIKTDTGKVSGTVPLGRYPRGIAISPDSATAYIALMGGNEITKVNLKDLSKSRFTGTEGGPRHIVISPAGDFLYVTNNASGTVSKFNTSDGKRVASIPVGRQPRSMAISSDGSALYVVVYEASKVVKLDSTTMRVIGSWPTGVHPIGVTYEPTKRRFWVATYGGTIDVYDDTAQ